MDQTEETKPLSRFEQFKKDAHGDWTAYRKRVQEEKLTEFSDAIKQLEKLQNRINSQMLTYLFGQRLGDHYAQKFVNHNRNLLLFLDYMDDDARFYLLHQLKTNEFLFANC